MNLLSVILCGGSGSRLWPLSREQYPKQLLALVGEAGITSHQIGDHPGPKCRHKIPRDPRLDAKRPKKLR